LVRLVWDGTIRLGGQLDAKVILGEFDMGVSKFIATAVQPRTIPLNNYISLPLKQLLQ